MPRNRWKAYPGINNFTEVYDWEAGTEPHVITRGQGKNATVELVMDIYDLAYAGNDTDVTATMLIRWPWWFQKFDHTDDMIAFKGDEDNWIKDGEYTPEKSGKYIVCLIAKTRVYEEGPRPPELKPKITELEYDRDLYEWLNVPDGYDVYCYQPFPKPYNKKKKADEEGEE